MKIPDKYMKKVEILPWSGCWVWMGAASSNEYGSIRLSDGKAYSAHKVFFEFATGNPVPAGKVLMHSCDVRCCCNPEHLTVGTYKANGEDMVRKGRSTAGRPNNLRGTSHPNHKLSEGQALQIKRSGGYRAAIEVGRKFGVSASLSMKIYYGERNWSWLGQ